jgi:PadR family transcriptional regulator AphA
MTPGGRRRSSGGHGVRAGEDELLLGEWACLGIVCAAPAHGFAVAAELRPDGPIGRVWSMSRALTYRSLDQLVERGLVRVVGEEPGIAGGTRTVLGPTRSGGARLRRWLAEPVAHLRDLRTELLLKVVLADRCGIDAAPMLARQRARVAELAGAIAAQAPPVGPPTGSRDVVILWRLESSQAALRFVDRLLALRRVPPDIPTPDSTPAR